MAGRLPAVRTLTVQRDYEFARLQQQLLSLAYEHLLPIVRPPTRAGRGGGSPNRAGAATGCLLPNKEVLDYASV
jgi:hypothetical protein